MKIKHWGGPMSGSKAAKRERLFDLFVNQPNHADVTHGRIFWCPLCRQPFERSDCSGTTPRLTLGHIIPESQGGKFKTLCCVGCNSGNGHTIEVDHLKSQQASDAFSGRGKLPILLGVNRNIKAELSHTPSKGIDIKVITPMANPAVQEHIEQLRKIQNGDSFKINFRWYRSSWCKATVCQSAYLLMFRAFGYDFARCRTYNPLRRQVLEPNEDHKDVLITRLDEDLAIELLENKQAAILFVSRPQLCIMVVMKFVSPGEIARYETVILPGPEEEPLPEFEMALNNFQSKVYVHDSEASKCWGLPLGHAWHFNKQLASGPVE